MITSPALLEQHITLVRKLGATTVHLDEWLEKQSQNRQLPRLAVAITFDDGWRDNFEHAFPKLREQNTPATIFLVTRLINSKEIFWPERVLQLITTEPIPDEAPEYEWLIPFLPGRRGTKAPLDPQEADEVITRLKSLSDESIYGHLRENETAVSKKHQFKEEGRAILNDQEIAEMAQSGLVKFGAHTRNHYRLNRLTDPTHLKSEIVGCLEDLRTLGSALVPVFCYPNGDITKGGEALVKENFKAACTTQTGWNIAASRSPFELHRFNLHDGNSFTNIRFLASLGRGIK